MILLFMKEHSNTMKNFQPRLFLLSWLIVPVVALWIATNYIIGLDRKPIWNAPNNQEVAAQSPASAIKTYNWNGRGLITLWFDDAWDTQYSAGYPEMTARNLSGALAVPTKAIGTDNYMGWAQVRLLQSKGWEVTSHSQTHDCNLKDLTIKFEDKELSGSKADLQRHGIIADNYVPPCGAINNAVTNETKMYYSSLRTSYAGLNSLPISDPYNLKVHTLTRDTSIEEVNSWISEAKNDKSWLILVFHQINDDTTQYGINKGMLTNTLDAVKASDLSVVLPSQALQIQGAQ
jgi:hypothetical protein